ncbi:MAG: hypothetical protein WC054_12585 [Candidatus Nanopelagicales bacterium]
MPLATTLATPDLMAPVDLLAPVDLPADVASVVQPVDRAAPKYSAAYPKLGLLLPS